MKESTKKGVSDLTGLRGIRTMRSGGKRSIPGVMQGSSYLDLYMRSKEKDRLEREMAHLDKRKTENEKRITEIEKEIGTLKAQEEGRVKKEKRAVPAGISRKKWKTMAVSF
jgi:hypothetical protein